ncbi:hypothetical protein [Methylobacterium oryzisoli]|uniref:hypothetical protein n=1 Tax=Methylobacterium oryzisoli TaxID=3385502 RepID=UPI003891F706
MVSQAQSPNATAERRPAAAGVAVCFRPLALPALAAAVRAAAGKPRGPAGTARTLRPAALRWEPAGE